MALKTKHISKRDNGTYIITAEETSLQIGTDEKGDPIYQTFSVIHNPKDKDTVLQEKFTKEIQRYKQKQEALATVKSKVDTVLAEIDYSKL
ncbi:MAG: hypothetical protein JRH08_00765 [Deltaproteobacteria bacterium]|nr:hypothetical protein [Deltaproteobacteria bacterium]MBW2124235.1 hypothetical protein [Deltaproteobacteria bacterium]